MREQSSPRIATRANAPGYDVAAGKKTVEGWPNGSGGGHGRVSLARDVAPSQAGDINETLMYRRKVAVRGMIYQSQTMMSTIKLTKICCYYGPSDICEG